MMYGVQSPSLHMSKKMASILIAHGVLLAILGFTLQRISPAQAKVAFPTCLVGGALCVLCGFLGRKSRAWAVMSLIPVTFVLLSEVVSHWISIIDTSSDAVLAALMVTLMMVLPAAMLIYLLHGERPPEFYKHTPQTRRNSAPGGRDA
jgi:hypothetical protein